MATWTAAPSLALLRRRPQTAARRGVSRRRWSLAGTVEISLQSAAAALGHSYWPRIPHANRVVIAEPMQEIVALLRDPGVEIPDEALPRILALATHPASPAFGSYPIQARFAAYSLLDELRTPADCVPS